MDFGCDTFGNLWIFVFYYSHGRFDKNSNGNRGRNGSGLTFFEKVWCGKNV